MPDWITSLISSLPDGAVKTGLVTLVVVTICALSWRKFTQGASAGETIRDTIESGIRKDMARTHVENRKLHEKTHSRIDDLEARNENIERQLAILLDRGARG